MRDACATRRVAPGAWRGAGTRLTIWALAGLLLWSMPLLALDRIYVRNAAVHTPLSLPRKPWDKLSDHAPLAAEILL